MDLNDVAIEEYRALRATIRERGTARLLGAVAVFVAWAALLVWVQSTSNLALWTLIPLTTLAAGFEVVLALHVGVERIGRYLQVYYETTTPRAPAWERLAMGAPPAALRLDALFVPIFTSAAILNFLAAIFLDASDAPPGGNPLFGMAIRVAYAAAHGLFLLRVYRAQRFAAGQRAADLARFQREARAGVTPPSTDR